MVYPCYCGIFRRYPREGLLQFPFMLLKARRIRPSGLLSVILSYRIVTNRWWWARIRSTLGMQQPLPARGALVTIEFRILGRTGLRVGDDFTAEWGAPKERGVLAVLLLHAGKALH